MEILPQGDGVRTLDCRDAPRADVERHAEVVQSQPESPRQYQPRQHQRMSEHQQLLDEARQFCDPTTGEVMERIPEDLMKQLRTAKLARGIPGTPSQRTESYATWFVLVNDEIRERVLAEWRKANAARKRSRGKGV